MADKPILFSAPMVRALLAGTKTQTRRAIDPGLMVPPCNMRPTDKGVPVSIDDWGITHYRPTPIQPGDRLYVREHWRTSDVYDAIAPRDLTPPIGLWYEADEKPVGGVVAGRFRQGMHMPRWASRLTLHVTEARVQRLQDISEEDAKAEGWDGKPTLAVPSAINWYFRLWDEINGKGEAAKNPWVAAYTFEVERCNIAQARKAA